MWGLGVASGSVLAGHYWSLLSGQVIFLLAGASTLAGLCFTAGLPKKIQMN
jgi:PPP family 3-phenylpropionic acid transporter